MTYFKTFEPVVKECLIDGKITPYDVCGTSELQKTKDFYGDRYYYIGSGYTYYINGTENISKTLHHFFNQK